ncbi:hypothetical protein A7E78_02540 [Syntrophotalea acetylenivorans]|uniref:Glycine-zipper-containing OmpA-like membrane domain-containing protein n=1 Tax=Syntrophotalea acetylenivorans TaxID=1842532 RepID=A0A1L3GLM6_9BACT|nr:glycine zipper domain-containing protein [Syntrophotalea acetylenivorans]APG26824.1 hypothetical protein A7E78_02540 [Syntrophotalea acetylenivorans]
MKIAGRTWWVVAFGVAVAVLIGTGGALTPMCRAQEPIVYPSQGQAPDQVEKDKYDCYQWARQQTGFDPMQPPTAQTPPPQQKGGALKGAAGGALLGAAVGAIAGDTGTGAAIGAASGGIIGGARRRQSSQQQEQWAQQQQASYEQQRGQYNRAWGACMEGKGYTVR